MQLKYKESIAAKSAPYSRKLEYIEGTGTQWINTGINSSDDLVLDIVASDFGSYQAGLFGNDWFFPSCMAETAVNDKNVLSITAYICSKQILVNDYQPNQKYSIHIDRTKLVVNGVLADFDMETQTGVTVHEPCGVFDTVKHAWIHPKPNSFKLYSIKIAYDSNVVFDAIPVLDENNRPCLYDAVSQKFFYNSGTGEFLYA